MSQPSYLPPSAHAHVPPLPSYGPRAGATASPAANTIPVSFKGVHNIKQKDGFFKVEYSLDLPDDTEYRYVSLAIETANSRKPLGGDNNYLNSDHVTRLPSIAISPIPLKYRDEFGNKKLGVSLTEYQAKRLLWFIMNFGAWGQPVTAYLIVAVRPYNGSMGIKASNPVTFDAPLEPVSRVGFEVGRVDTTRQLGALLTAQNIPYETNSCLLLNLNLFGANLLFFHASKKLITATHAKLRRGVDCITFLDAALGTNADHVMGRTGQYIADAAGATMVLNGVLGDGARAYFNDADRQIWESRNFVFWWSEHCVAIVRGLVCEYSRTALCYRETPIQEYLRPFRNSTLYLAQL